MTKRKCTRKLGQCMYQVNDESICKEMYVLYVAMKIICLQWGYFSSRLVSLCTLQYKKTIKML